MWNFYEIKRKKTEFELEKKQLYAVAFINENQKINPLAFKAFNIISLNEDDDLEKKYELVINEFLNENHPRASFEKEKTVTDLFLDEGY